MDRMCIVDFPLPPSLNASYKTGTKTFYNPKTRRMGVRSEMYASESLTVFKKRVELFKRQHWSDLNELRLIIDGWTESGFDIAVDYYFLWPHDDIFTKTKKAKNKYHRLDADNRIKAGRDALASCLEIDDTNFITGKIEKAIQDEGKEPCAIIVISKTKIRTAKEILQQFNEQRSAL